MGCFYMEGDKVTLFFASQVHVVFAREKREGIPDDLQDSDRRIE